jgi:DNA primase
MFSPETTKYIIHIYIKAEGVVEKSDVVGAIFGQTEGLLGEDLDLRDLQRTGRVGRIDVQITSKKGETKGEILIASSLDKAETALLAASLETIDRVGPCNSRVKVERIEDIRITKRRKIVDRAKELLLEQFDEGSINSNEILDIVREYSRIEKISSIGDEKLPSGPNVFESDAIIIVEGRADVINLLRYGIKNAVAVEGTNVPEIIIKFSESKTTTAFLDGDRGGDLILSELLQVADLDYVAFSPRGRSVEELTRKEIIKSLRNKVPVEFVEPQGELERQKPQQRTPVPIPIAVGEDVQVLKQGSDTVEKTAVEEKIGDILTIKDHMAEVAGSRSARFLSPEFEIISESGADNFDELLNSFNGDVTGLVIDKVINQKLLDLCAGKGIKYIAAPDFKGIIKKPISIRLIKIM